MSGSFIFEKRVPDVDPPAVRRLQQAGGVMLGKTTTPEFGWKGLGDSPLTGITRNPWNTGMTTGRLQCRRRRGDRRRARTASSGIRTAPGRSASPADSAASSASKPSYGRVPMWPVSNNDYASHMGPMTRTVADAALMLSVMAGPDDWDRTSLEAAPDGLRRQARPRHHRAEGRVQSRPRRIPRRRRGRQGVVARGQRLHGSRLHRGGGQAPASPTRTT